MNGLTMMDARDVDLRMRRGEDCKPVIAGYSVEISHEVDRWTQRGGLHDDPYVANEFAATLRGMGHVHVRVRVVVAK